MSKKSSAKNRWENLNIAYESYLEYIASKEDKFSLSFIDLLHVSNFKGGNASICEYTNVADEKLKQYASLFVEIDNHFGEQDLANLSQSETVRLSKMTGQVVALCNDKLTAIKGFKASYCSAMLNAHFPNLIPILDRRVLINSGVVSKPEDVNSQKQIKKIEDHYGGLIEEMQRRLKSTDKSLRQLDKEIFTQELVIPKKNE